MQSVTGFIKPNHTRSANTVTDIHTEHNGRHNRGGERACKAAGGPPGPRDSHHRVGGAGLSRVLGWTGLFVG